ncbi:MAG: adenosylcobinamide-GDP ribazoletransferase [Lachnospiraceae bacterium]|nr:adenosylcobinamide-GDP ribazoletransferase [Lachnospiraceae bacterium]
MNILKGICIAFAMYSKLWVPQFAWKEENMKYAIGFFPFVGAVLGVVFFGWNSLCAWWQLPDNVRAIGSVLVLVLISGGIHLDGFADTVDAISSYASREKRLEILKDPHIGAFGVIGLIVYFLGIYSAFCGISSKRQVVLATGIFFQSRIMSAIGVVTIRNAKGEGTLYAFQSPAHKHILRIWLLLLLLLSLGYYYFFGGLTKTGVIAGTGAVVYGYYLLMSKKRFGGITGDLAGYFLTLLEGIWLLEICIMAG